MLKRSLSLLLAIVVAFGLTTVAFAAPASGDRVTDVILSVDSSFRGYSDTVSPGDVWHIPLTADMFSWQSGNSYKATDPVTSAQLKDITLFSSVTKGSSFVSIALVHNKTYNGLKTSYIDVTFDKNWDKSTAQAIEFEIGLRRNRNRDRDADASFEVSLEKEVQYVDASDEYYVMDKNIILEATEYIKSIDLELARGMYINTRMLVNRKYSGYAESGITEADLPILDKYNDTLVEVYYNVKVSGITTTGTPITIEDLPDCFAYDKNLKFLGSTNSALPFADKYYIFEKAISASDVGTGNTGSTSGSGSTTGSGNSGLVEPVAPGATTPNVNINGNTAALSDSDLAILTTNAVNNAKASGSKTATVRVTDVKSASAAGLKAMASSATSAGMSALFNADTMSGNSIAGRLTLTSANAAKVTGNITLGVFPSNAHTAPVASKFTKWYSNDLRVLTLEHNGSYGTTVNIAAKLDLGSMKTTNLHLYSYDRNANQFRLLNDTGAFVDKNGFFQFKTTYGNDIIISDGPLKRK